MIHEFRDEIMNAVFVVRCDAPDVEAKRLHAVAEEIFDEIRLLESLLSRFIEDSDISQVNRLSRGESVVVAAETFRCLELAEEATHLTNGYFDIAYLSPAVSGRPFSLLTKPHRVRSEVESLRLDLGGIGKGFALDHVSQIPLRFGYSRVLLCADSSTMLALDPPENKLGWEIHVEIDGNERFVELKEMAISCSGTLVRGKHIFDTKQCLWAEQSTRCYLLAPSATLADAFSTAGFVNVDAVEHVQELEGGIWLWQARGETVGAKRGSDSDEHVGICDGGVGYL